MSSFTPNSESLAPTPSLKVKEPTPTSEQTDPFILAPTLDETSKEDTEGSLEISVRGRRASKTTTSDKVSKGSL